MTKLDENKFISSLLYTFIGDAFGTPFDGLNPNFIFEQYPQGFYFYEQPLPMSKNNQLAAGSISDVTATLFMIMETLIDKDTINSFDIKRGLNKLSKNSSFHKHNFEANYQNFEADDYTYRMGVTNIVRSLPLVLLKHHLDKEELKKEIDEIGLITHKNENSRRYNIFHNLMLRDLIYTNDLALSIFNNIDELPTEKDKEILYKIIQEYKATGRIDLTHIEHITYINDIEDTLYANYPIVIATCLNDNLSLIEKFLTTIYLGGNTAFNCAVIGTIYGLLKADIQNIDENFLAYLHYGNEIRIIDIYDLADALYKKYSTQA